LVQLARRVGKGDLTVRADVKSNNELGELASELNSMVDRLHTADRELAAATQARMKALDQLRHADRLATVGRLASGIAHELGTPINVVHGRAKMINKNISVPEPARDHARIIVEQSDRITGIIRQLLDFARPSESRREVTDMERLVKGVLHLLEPMAAKRSVRLTFDCSVDLPQPELDQAQIQQVVSNLVVNAVQAMSEPGEISLDLREVSSERTGNTEQGGRYLRLQVRDDGPGMPSEVRARVFEPFFTTKDVGEGTGLGLSVAWGIVHEHGGWIEVESSEGEGTLFSVYLPRPVAEPGPVSAC
jgi:signal transduction histidine kinase